MTRSQGENINCVIFVFFFQVFRATRKFAVKKLKKDHSTYQERPNRLITLIEISTMIVPHFG